MPPRDRLFQAAVITLLIISVGLIIAGAALSYQNGLGSGARLYQFGKLLLLGSGGFAIWYFKWSRGKARASEAKLPKMTNGVYAIWFFVAAVLLVATYLQAQETSYTADDRLWTLLLAVVPPVLAASVVAFFIVRDAMRSELNEKPPHRSKAGSRPWSRRKSPR